MTLASILMPHWVSYIVTAEDTGSTFTKTIGLHKSCSSVADPPCQPFPQDEICRGDERTFCSMWRTTGFLMSFATVAELAALVGFIVIIGGGKMKREFGWKVLGTILCVVGVIQFAAMAIVAWLFDNDEQFIVPGWHLDKSWILCTVSGGIAILCALGLAISAFVLPPEEGYEFLDDPLDV
ncbi:putative lysine-sensitive aspartokinase 3 protein [Phaeoacremonium minimum UCRPA7]|uniref:Putative lysine-sensitive aspartokinase 3 protein n=1 Tax=Phaeoacremonium minimum (strain UCR-PA7) TaxID=1286976 RepID=R8BXM5_PHAM7|nr:putative lysine-sensitive aspartokinase 3 protein [Phaeoacremonium minimum UCRPA7]EOO04156.1 putative lysine-sensitive aspartokinase 3 protein [Phaeoacremonium minimum UCRPA7]